MKAGLAVTPRMQEAFDLVTLHGTRLAAAEPMGISSVAVGQFVAAYCRRTGAPPPYARSRPYALAARLVADAKDRTATAEREVRDLRAMLAASDAHADRLTEALEASEARCRDLERRLAERPVPFVPDHRRIKDGGKPVRQQRREQRRVA